MRFLYFLLSLMAFILTGALEADTSKKPEIVLYYTPTCPHSKKVLNYLGKIHKTVPMINVQGNAKAKEQLQAASGDLRVPCLVVDSDAICGAENVIDWLSGHQTLLSQAP